MTGKRTTVPEHMGVCQNWGRMDDNKDQHDVFCHFGGTRNTFDTAKCQPRLMPNHSVWHGSKSPKSQGMTHGMELSVSAKSHLVLHLDTGVQLDVIAFLPISWLAKLGVPRKQKIQQCFGLFDHLPSTLTLQSMYISRAKKELS